MSILDLNENEIIIVVFQDYDPMEPCFVKVSELDEWVANTMDWHDWKNATVHLKADSEEEVDISPLLEKHHELLI